MKRNILSRLLCPYREYTLETRLTKEQVLGTMRARTERKDRIFRFPKGKIYVGDVDDNGFCVAVSKSFFNQVSQVQITAGVTESNSGSLISVRTKLSEPVFTFYDGLAERVPAFYCPDCGLAHFGPRGF